MNRRMNAPWLLALTWVATGCGGSDEVLVDAGDSADAAESDAAIDAPTGTCGGDQADIIAHWRFEALPSPSEANGPAAVEDGVDSLGLIEGPSPQCGMALQIPVESLVPNLTYARIADDPAFDDIAALDMFIRPPADQDVVVAVLGRDAGGTTDGDILVLLATSTAGDRLVVVRLQNQGGTSFRCARIPPPTNWFHFAANLTSQNFDLYIDGELANEGGGTSVQLFGTERGCVSGLPRVPAPSAQDFTVGAVETNGVPSSPFQRGAVDNIRFFASARNFSAN